jgi:hypothetical protein
VRSAMQRTRWQSSRRERSMNLKNSSSVIGCEQSKSQKGWIPTKGRRLWCVGAESRGRRAAPREHQEGHPSRIPCPEAAVRWRFPHYETEHARLAQDRARVTRMSGGLPSSSWHLVYLLNFQGSVLKKPSCSIFLLKTFLCETACQVRRGCVQAFENWK